MSQLVVLLNLHAMEIYCCWPHMGEGDWSVVQQHPGIYYYYMYR